VSIGNQKLFVVMDCVVVRNERKGEYYAILTKLNESRI